MLRIVCQRVFYWMLLTVCCVSFCTDLTAQTHTRAGGKQIYSNRPAGYSAPAPYYGTPMAPRFIAPPAVPARTYGAHAPAIESGPAMPMQAPIITESSPSQQISQQTAKETVIVLRDSPPEISVTDELDAFYARLAKIQLEKRQLPEALALIQQIKSETFKVRTLVNLAEFVSRDKNYQSEAEQLYRLALAGMEALDKRRPFHIDASAVRDVSPSPPQLQQPAVSQPDPPPATPGRRPAVVQLLDDEPSELSPARPALLPEPPPESPTVRNGNGKLPPPPTPPTGDRNDIIFSPPAIPDSTEPSVSPTETIVKPDYGISLEGDEPGDEPEPEPPPAPTTRRPRPIPIVIPDEN